MDIKQKLAYNVTEAALLLGVSRPKLYEMTNMEGFPCIRTGGERTRIIIPAKPLEAWLEKMAEQGATA